MDENKLMMFRRLRNKVRKVTRYRQKCQEKEIANEAKTNPKKFWQHVNRRTKTTSGIADLETPNNTLTSKDNEKAEILANFLTSVFTKEKLGDIPTMQNKIVHEDLKQFTRSKKKLMKLNPAKSSGSGNLHSKTLYELANVLDKLLKILFQNTLTIGKIPEEWKHANVTAIFKKGDRNKPNNYRPVSLTCIICKIMESLKRDQIMSHKKKHKLFSDKQFGFLEG